MRILMVSSVLRPKEDKIRDFLYEVGEALVGEGHKVMILAAHAEGIPKRDSFKGIEIRRFQYFWPASFQRLAYGDGLAQNIRKSLLAKIQVPFYLLSEWVACFGAVREFRPDLVQALWTFPQGLVVSCLKPFMGFKMALHVFGAEPFLAKNYRLPFLVIWPAKKADLLTANSRAALDASVGLGVDRKKLKLFFLGGVNTGKFNAGNDGAKIRKRHAIGKGKMVLVVGRIVERKGHVFLVRAMPLVLKKFPEAKLVVVGYGPEEERLRKEAEGLGILDKVVFTGKVSAKELSGYYAACDVFCLPAIVDSCGETEGGQGMVLGEAMASGKPVVASNVGGIPDAVKNEWNGLLVPEKDSKKLADAICRVFSEKGLSKKLVKNGFAFVEREISYKAVGKNLGMLYRQALKQK
jgi:glycosyltransferase involved in cell wall biosynthesis